MSPPRRPGGEDDGPGAEISWEKLAVLEPELGA